jgi:hypothetical protein
MVDLFCHYLTRLVSRYPRRRDNSSACKALRICIKKLGNVNSDLQMISTTHFFYVHIDRLRVDNQTKIMQQLKR